MALSVAVCRLETSTRENCAEHKAHRGLLRVHVWRTPAPRILAQSLKQALGSIDVRLLDHLILCKAGSYSFAKSGLL